MIELDVIIVGAGLGGLAAANGLRRAGHRVRVFEKSSFKNEIGAGITIAPNASRILKTWGFDFDKATITGTVRIHDGVTLEQLSSMTVNQGPEPILFNIFRPDYHAELWRLAVDADGDGPPANIRLGAEIITADPDTGTIYLSDGSSHSADLIIGADGVHSKMRELVVLNEFAVSHTGFNAYRFMGSTDDLLTDPDMKTLLETKIHDWCGYKIGAMETLLIWYDLRSGTLQNYVLMFRSGDVPLSLKGTNPEDIKHSLMDDAKGLHPTLQKVISTGVDIKPWRMIIQEPLRTWIKGNLLLVGDAAHPVNPMTGQGVNTSIEDGATLQVLLRNLQNISDLAPRLQAFEDLRLNRTAIIQHLASIFPGQEEAVAEKIKPYLKGHSPIVTGDDRNKFILGYDTFAAAEEALARIESSSPSS